MPILLGNVFIDDRTGTTMLKAHLPAESGSWILYALAVAEPLFVAPRSVFYTPTPRASNELGALGGGARAEVLLGGWELGVDGVAQRGMDPRLGVDLSGGFWEVDLRAEFSEPQDTLALDIRSAYQVPELQRLERTFVYHRVAPASLTVNAPPDRVWPWLVQLGQDRAGFYSYTLLENLFGCHMRNTYRIVPRWQHRAAGDGVLFHPKMPRVPVVACDPGRALVIGGDCNSRILNPADIKTYPLFGDGAGAVVVEASEGDNGKFGNDRSYWKGADCDRSAGYDFCERRTVACSFADDHLGRRRSANNRDGRAHARCRGREGYRDRPEDSVSHR